LWWNPIGFLVALLAAWMPLPGGWRTRLGRPEPRDRRRLLAMTGLILLVCLGFQML
jgi:hypothetical protein